MSSWENRMMGALRRKRDVAHERVLSPELYILVVGAATCLYVWLMGALLAQQTGWLGMIVGPSLAATLYRRVRLVPAVPRTSFRDYMPSNLVVASVWIALLLCALYGGPGAERGWPGQPEQEQLGAKAIDPREGRSGKIH